MHIRSTRTRIRRPRLALALLALPALASAQTPPASAYTELSRSTVETPGQKVTYIEIEPPAPRRRMPPPPPPPLTAAQQAEADRLAAKRSGTLMLSATVYPGAPTISVLRWWHGGREWRAYADFDARIAAHVGQVESPGAVFSVFASVGAAETGDPGRPVGLRFADGAEASWLIDANEAEITTHPEAFEGVEAWINHYNTHRAQLVLEHARLEFEAAVRERERLARPPKRAEMVIRYWKSPDAATAQGTATETQR